MVTVLRPQPEGSPLLIMLEEVMTMDRNALAHTLVRFFIAHGAIIPFLDCLVSQEVQQTREYVCVYTGDGDGVSCGWGGGDFCVCMRLFCTLP